MLLDGEETEAPIKSILCRYLLPAYQELDQHEKEEWHQIWQEFGMNPEEIK